MADQRALRALGDECIEQWRLPEAVGAHQIRVEARRRHAFIAAGGGAHAGDRLTIARRRAPYTEICDHAFAPCPNARSSAALLVVAMMGIIIVERMQPGNERRIIACAAVAAAINQGPADPGEQEDRAKAQHNRRPEHEALSRVWFPPKLRLRTSRPTSNTFS